MTTLHEHLISDKISPTNNKFKAGFYSSCSPHKPKQHVGIVGICPVVDRSIFHTRVADFWAERQAQLKAWKSKPTGPGTAHQISGIGSEIAWLTGNFSYLADLNSAKTSTALKRLQQADEVFIYMETGLGFLDPDYLQVSGHRGLSVGSPVHSHTFTGLIFREGRKWTQQLIDSPDIILAATATEQPSTSLKACIVETENVRPMREIHLDRLVDIYKVEWEWAYLMRNSLPADYLCI